MNEFLADTVRDYERTFIGSFISQFFHASHSLGFFKSLDLSVSMTLFEADSAFSLIQGDE